MSARVLAALLAALAVASRPVSADDGATRRLDVAHSHAAFSVSHVYVSKVSGSVPVSSGSVVLAAGSAVPIRIDAVLDPKRVHTDDPDRDDDLQGPDWFDTAHYPSWTFVSTSVAAGADGTFVANGTLTVHGISQPLALHVTTVRGLPNPVYHAVGHASRHAFGMRKTAMDGLIGDDVEITIDAAVAP
jgi:polyisoprenoid-binding protein YceI